MRYKLFPYTTLFRSDADGQLSADDHEPAGQPDGDGGSDGELLGDGDGDRAAQLSVAEGRGADQRGDIGELHDAAHDERGQRGAVHGGGRSEEHTSELQSHSDLVCRLLLEKKKKAKRTERRQL